MRAEQISIETDEDGFHLRIQVIDGEADPVLDFLVLDPEDFYKQVRYAVEPWLREMKDARREQVALRRSAHAMHNAPDDLSEDAYDITDPKHPRYHSTHADVWDSREKESAA